MREGDYLPSCRQSGKVVQNVKYGEKFARKFGEERRRAVTGANNKRVRLPIVDTP